MVLIKVKEKLYDNRIVRIDTDINSAMAADVCSELQAMDDEGRKPIMLYINSPGGEIGAGLSIIDTMNSLKSMVFTINTHMCASMGAAILSCGAKRMALPHSRVMIHQASSGVQGNIQDMLISLRETERLNDELAKMIAENCGKTVEEYKEDTLRDRWMTAEEALKYGIIDEIVGNKKRKIWTPEMDLQVA